MDNLLLRGCQLKNVSRAFGIVLYSGKYTKLVQNTMKVTQKVSNLMRIFNRVLFTIFTFQGILVVIMAIISSIWASGHKNLKYASDDDEDLEVTPFYVIQVGVIFYV